MQFLEKNECLRNHDKWADIADVVLSKHRSFFSKFIEEVQEKI